MQHEPQTPQLVVSPHEESEIDDAKEAIRRDRAHHQLRAALLEGANSPVAADADAAYFESLHKSVETGI